MFGKILLGLAVTAILIITLDNNIKLSLLTINNNLNSKKMSKELSQLTSDVAELSTVEDSVLAFLAGIEDQLNAVKDDPAAITQLSLDIRAQKEKLAAAIVANTPAATTTTDTNTNGGAAGSEGGASNEEGAGTGTSNVSEGNNTAAESNS